MVLKIHSLIPMIGLMALSACGGRVANIIEADNILDSKFSCTHLKGEFENHDKRLVELLGERDDKGMHNFGMLITSPLFLDLSTAQKDEAESIAKRQERLTELMSTRACS